VTGRARPPCRRCGTPLRDLNHDGGRHSRCPWYARLALLLRVRRGKCAACGKARRLTRAGGYLVCADCRPAMTTRRSR
jgi:hypothetical protein